MSIPFARPGKEKLDRSFVYPVDSFVGMHISIANGGEKWYSVNYI